VTITGHNCVGDGVRLMYFIILRELSVLLLIHLMSVASNGRIHRRILQHSELNVKGSVSSRRSAYF